MSKNYLTEATEVTGEVSVFAKPNDSYDRDDPESEPFTYVFREGRRHWNERYVLVCTHEVTLSVPPGVNLVSQAIETLNNIIAEKRAELQAEVVKLEAEIAKLMLITYQP